MNFSFVGIKWRQFLIIKLPFSLRTLYERGRSFGAITDPFLFQVFSSSVVILMVSPGFKVYRPFWVVVLVVEGLGCGLAEGGLVRIRRLNNLWAGDNPFSSGWEFNKSIDKQWSSFANFAFLRVYLTVCILRSTNPFDWWKCGLLVRCSKSQVLENDLE